MGNPMSAADVSTPVSRSDQREAYLASLLASVQAAVPADLALPEIRATAVALVKEQTFPSTRQEDWRFTDLSAMLSVPFQAALGTATANAAALEPLALPESAGTRVVLVNGRFDPSLSDVQGLPDGVILGSLQTLYDGNLKARLEQRLAQSSGGHEVFTALNTAGFRDAVILWVPPHVEVDTPIQIISFSLPQAEPVITLPRCLVVAESGSRLTLVEDFWGTASGDHLTNAVSEIWVDANAQVNHVRVQREGDGTFHIGKTVVTQARDSRYYSTAISLGARLSRHHFEVYQTGEQTDTKLYGLGAIAAHQHTDTHSLIALTHPHGTVDQLHKCIVDDHAHSVFSGRIVVPQAAQLTNARQLNRNLLLSDKARVDTKPQLEIVADNVKCAHGATVSQLEADEIFYLQSRGISQAQAQRLLIYAFAMEVVDTLPVESLRAALTQLITERTT